MTTTIARCLAFVLCLALVITSCSDPKIAEKGDHVTVHFVGRTLDGQVFDSTTYEDPMTFVVGNQEVVIAVDQAIQGMKEGESKKFKAGPNEAYGPRNEQAMAVLDRSRMPADLQLEVGKTIQFTPPEGRVQNFTIVALTDDSVTVDGNHPLAGQTVEFDLTLIEVDKSRE